MGVKDIVVLSLKLGMNTEGSMELGNSDAFVIKHPVLDPGLVLGVFVDSHLSV